LDRRFAHATLATLAVIAIDVDQALHAERPRVVTEKT
jgi:hypothetical protein